MQVLPVSHRLTHTNHSAKTTPQFYINFALPYSLTVYCMNRKQYLHFSILCIKFSQFAYTYNTNKKQDSLSLCFHSYCEVFTMRFSGLQILFDLCYLVVLCGIILMTFCYVFLPAQPAMALLHSQAMPVFQHTASSALPIEIAMLCAIVSLVYLKCIWRFICR